MRVQWSACRGMTLMELLIALGLGASLSATIMQLFVGSMHMQSAHSAVQDLQQRAAYVQFLLRSAIRGAASPCAIENRGLMNEVGHYVDVLFAPDAPVTAMAESQVLRLRSPDCDVPVHFYYIGRRGSNDDNPAGLFRRRQRGDGSYYAAEELIEGVTAMTASLGILVPPADSAPTAAADVAYVSVDQVSDWSRVFSVNLTMSLQPMPEGATVHMTFAGLSNEGLTISFSTSLRQVELHRTIRAP